MTKRPWACLVLAVLLLAACQPRTGDRRRDERLSPVRALADAGGSGFLRALEPREFLFPRDHGPHPEYKVEWWYFVGNLQDRAGRRFGFQLTFFRNALVAEMPERASAWATAQLYMAHFALSDVDGKTFSSFERTSRGGALGLAGVETEPFRLWLEDWSVASSGEGFLPLKLRARSGDVALDLELAGSGPPVLHGEDGLSRKGAAPGNASYYYSYTRLPTQGTVRLGEDEWKVDGSAWMDREWSTSSLDEEQVGWDWFALQLDDGRDLMLFQVRRKDGTIEPASHGTLVEADGRARTLLRDDVELIVERAWTSPTGSVYPAGWTLSIPAEGRKLRIEPLLADQELDVSFRYWEGAVEVREVGGTVRGRGYVELVGYAGPAP